MILKILMIIGIILLVIISILIFLILLILFVPIRYKLDAKKQEDLMEAKAHITWLSPVLRFNAWYKDHKTGYWLKIFFYKLMDSDESSEEIDKDIEDDIKKQDLLSEGQDE